ncbi:kinase-like domain-containing protein [Blakeslea trispora]|nr:kinase-like domain-containing protein [Blakeslea trispora]
MSLSNRKKSKCRRTEVGLEDNQRELKKSRLSVAHLDPLGLEPNDAVLSIMELLSQFEPKHVRRAINTYMSIQERDVSKQTQVNSKAQARCFRNSLLTVDSTCSSHCDNNSDKEEKQNKSASTLDVNALQVSENNMTPTSSPDKPYNIRNKSSTCCFSVKEESSVDSRSFLGSPRLSESSSNRTSKALSEPPLQRQHNRKSKCTSFKESSSFLSLATDILPQLEAKRFVVTDVVLGTGQMSSVRLGRYGNLPVACKSKRGFTNTANYYAQAKREMTFAACLSTCRYMNKYLGWIVCRQSDVEEKSPTHRPKQAPKLYIVQRYISNRDGRTYLNSRETIIQPQEVLQASICLFSALADAHNLDIGFVDLKLENFLIDSSGAGYLTDFGSCIMLERGQKKSIDLKKHDITWTKTVAPPEMLNNHSFTRASDVFMATVILAEMMTPEINYRDFQRLVLRRHTKPRHEVDFSSEHIHERYHQFFPLLRAGLANSQKKRPTAQVMLDTLLQMRRK